MAKSSSSLSPFRLAAESWAFLQSQPALFSVLFWFLILPVVLLDLLTEYWPQSEVISIQQIGDMGYILATLIFTVVAFWGLACVLLVGRRQVLSRAGRSRTSFRSVRKESVRLIFPLFFTSLLRGVITIEWSLIAILPATLFLLGSQECRATLSPVISAMGMLLSTGSQESMMAVQSSFLTRCGPIFLAIPLLIPALIYQLRTVFFGIVLTSENLRYRDALRRSRMIVRGKTWRVLWVLVALGVLFFAPAGILSFVVDVVQQMTIPELPIVSTLISDVFYSWAGLLFTLALVSFYGRLYKEKGRVQEVVPE